MLLITITVLGIVINCSIGQPAVSQQHVNNSLGVISDQRSNDHFLFQSSEHIPLIFYESARTADDSKVMLQGQLKNFLEDLHRNLTTSNILNTMDSDTIDSLLKNNQNQIAKLNNLAEFFESTSRNARVFANDAVRFFEVTKNASDIILLKLRQVPAGQPMEVKELLTNYFAEMEFFTLMFSEIIDEALEYTQNTLRHVENSFMRFADIQREVLRDWNSKLAGTCCIHYMNFLQNWSAQIFQCAAGNELEIVYDIYAMTEINAKYIMRQLEFRIQRLFNCFLFGKQKIRCRFLQKPEEDFKKLFSKIEELEMYYDIKTNRGRVSISRNPRNDRFSKDNNDLAETVKDTDKCIPYGYPYALMPEGLKICLYMPSTN